MESLFSVNRSPRVVQEKKTVFSRCWSAGPGSADRNAGEGMIGMKNIVLVPVAAVVLLYGLGWPLARQSPGPGDSLWQAQIARADWSRHLDLGGYRLHYLDAGQGPPVLLLHGFGDSVYSWRHNIKPLVQAGFRVVALDLPGLGESETPAGFAFTVEAVAAQITAFLDALNVDRVDVVGNSLGGNLALFLARYHPDRIRRIVLTGPACYPSCRHDILSALARSPITAALVEPILAPWNFRLMIRFCYDDPDRVTDDNVSQRCLPLNRPDFRNNLIRLGGSYFSQGFLDLSWSYHRIAIPVLAVWGEHDRIIRTDRNAQRLHQDIPGSRLVIMKQAGHLPHEEQPGGFNRLMLDFLQAP